MNTAKLFWAGLSQAVRLPKEFRMNGSEVRIRHHGPCIVLEPIPQDWSWLDAIAGKMSSDFMSDGRDQPAMQERPGIDAAFD